MTRIPPSFLITWIVTASVAISTWFLIPGKGLDRLVFETMGKQIAEPPIRISGKGSHADPWQLKVSGAPNETGEMPTTIALKDNLEGIFQESPHSPIDLAVIFKNLQRLGAKDLACSVLLAWEEPDPLGLAAMESSLLDFDSVVLAAPVTRGAIMEPLPADFRRASLPIDQLQGDLSTLPVVNRIPIPTLIHGGENAMAGFEVIDSEPTAEHMHLMARWDDRVIFAFPVVAALQHLGLGIEDLHIEVGSHLQLGAQGPIIPIDEFGRLPIGVISLAPKTDLDAKELIDAEAGDKALPHLEQALLCDQRSHADISTRDFNRMIPSSMEKLLQGQARARETFFARLASSVELPLLLVLALTLSLAGLLSRPLMSLICAIAIVGCAFALWLGLHNGMWLPGPAAVATVLAAWACSMLLGNKRKRTTSMPRLDRLKFDSMEDAD